MFGKGSATLGGGISGMTERVKQLNGDLRVLRKVTLCWSRDPERRDYFEAGRDAVPPREPSVPSHARHKPFADSARLCCFHEERCELLPGYRLAQSCSSFCFPASARFFVLLASGLQQLGCMQARLTQHYCQALPLRPSLLLR